MGALTLKRSHAQATLPVITIGLYVPLEERNREAASRISISSPRVERPSERLVRFEQWLNPLWIAATPEWKKIVDDIPNFASGGATVLLSKIE